MPNWLNSLRARVLQPPLLALELELQRKSDDWWRQQQEAKQELALILLRDILLRQAVSWSARPEWMKPSTIARRVDRTII